LDERKLPQIGGHFRFPTAAGHADCRRRAETFDVIAAVDGFFGSFTGAARRDLDTYVVFSEYLPCKQSSWASSTALCC
jgi:hypothetical protein